jgi:hypothetical protein
MMDVQGGRERMYSLLLTGSTIDRPLGLTTVHVEVGLSAGKRCPNAVDLASG